MAAHFLEQLFTPQSIAVFGASEHLDAVGGRVFANLRDAGFAGPIYPVNPKYNQLYQQPCYSSIAAVAQPVDLAVITAPATTVLDIIHACGQHGVRIVIIISSGFNDRDEQGAALKKAALEAARHYSLRILGPNCLGLIRPVTGLNATFSKNTAKPGRLALVSQSGALCTTILDWAIDRNVGFSAVVSLGDAADISFGDVLDYLAQDPHTSSILLYVEGVGNARRFMSGLRIAGRMKPVVVIKAGRHLEGSRAAVTHTGAMVGSDDIFDAALQRAGVVRAMTIEQLFTAAELLAKPHRVSGKRLAIITNGGGLGVMATDCAVDFGLTLATLSENTLTELNTDLPEQWSHANPVDLLGDASAQRYQLALKSCLFDPAVDGVLVMLSPQAMTNPLTCAQAVIDANKLNNKLIIACWMGAQQVKAANTLFSQHHLPNYSNPESAIEAFAYLANYYDHQQLLMQVPSPLTTHHKPDIAGARLIIESVLAENRNILTIKESKAVLHAFAIPATQTIECLSADEALIAAESIGFPVAMKIHSLAITHKSDVGGVRLNINNAHAIHSTYYELLKEVTKNKPDVKIEGVTIEPMYAPSYVRELLIGVIRDPVFGPAITFGAGGTQVEILRDRAIALPPLNKFLAEKMISQTRIAQMLGSFRNMPAVNMDALVQQLLHVSEMICELPEIISLDINPLIADDNGVMALDARIVVERPSLSRDRYDHMAIHPYPNHLVSLLQLTDGTNITIRPIRPEDAAIEQDFVYGLSAQSKYFRFMQGLNKLTQQMLIRFTQLDYSRELALIAVLDSPDKEIELGVARYVMNPDGASCEFAVVVGDKWHGKGIGSYLMRELIKAARQRGIEKMEGEILTDNPNMIKLVKSLGFSVHSCIDDPGIIVACKQLQSEP